MAKTELLASDIVIVEEEPRVSAIPSIPTAVLGAVGVTERGPFGPTLIQGFDAWVATFGGYTATADLTLAALGFFTNGGATLWACRVVHMTNNTNPATRTSASAEATLTTSGAATQGMVTGTNLEPFGLADGDTIKPKVDGGGAETATIHATAAARVGSSGTYPTLFAGGETLELKINDGALQTIAFSAGAQALADVIDEINPVLVGGYADELTGELRLTSDRKGTGSKVEIVGGTGRATLGLAIGSTDGTGNVTDVSAVTADELVAIVEADTTAQALNVSGALRVLTPTVGSGGSIQIDATSTADDELGLDNSVHAGSAAGPGDMGHVHAKTAGAYANSLSAVVGAASSGQSSEFNLSITEGGVVLEVFPNLSTVLTAPRYWQSFVNSRSTGSDLVTVEDLLTGSPPANRPTNGTYPLSGGGDGLVGLTDSDFIGSSAGPTGLYELDAVENLTILIVPGRATSAVHQAMLAYCETWREGQAFAILDPPAGLTAAEIVTYVRTTAALKEFSEFGAIYWPRVKILNPSASVFTSDSDGNITVAPSGTIAGVYARTDSARPGGVYDPPAGIERGILYGVLGFETDEVLDKRKRGIVYPELINPLTTWSGVPRHIDGTRTLKSIGQFPTIAERRGVSFIERSIKIGLAFVRHSNNTRSLRRRCHRTVTTFLVGEMGRGAFASEEPDRAFFVDFSDALNQPSVVQSRTLKGRVGLATNKPIDWVIIGVSQDTRALDEQLAEIQAGR